MCCVSFQGVNKKMILNVGQIVDISGGVVGGYVFMLKGDIIYIGI